MIDVIQLDACTSTQDEVLSRLTVAAHGEIVAVSTRSQLAGRGREGRTWQDPPGIGLLLSVGVRGPVPTSTLAELPRDAVGCVEAAIGEQSPQAADLLRWKAPNDLVAAADGAKLAGVLVDARTIGSDVEQIIVGIGINLAGDAFRTRDGRAASSLAHVLGGLVDGDELRGSITRRIAARLTRDHSAATTSG